MVAMKKFLIIGNANAITYKEVFPLIKENKLWLGVSKRSMDFIVSDEGETVNVNACWFTNIDHNKRHIPLKLTKSYNATDYPLYDNYNGINVNKTVDIPMDYNGIMGVPITFMDKYCPEQFEIIGLGIANLGLSVGVKPYKPEHKKYRKEVQKRGAVDGDLYLMNGDEVKVPYARILIRFKK
jgi:hypothetical protein